MKHRIAGLALVLGCAVVSGAQAAPMTKEAYKAQQVRIEQEYDGAQASCRKREGNARDVCNEQVRGARDIQVAELQLQYQPTPDADEKVRLAKAEAVYAVTLQRCKALDGSGARDVCRKEARTVLGEARSEARLQKEVVALEMRANRVVRDREEIDEKKTTAQYNAARERCEMLPGEGRQNCLLDVNKRFGKI